MPWEYRVLGKWGRVFEVILDCWMKRGLGMDKKYTIAVAGTGKRNIIETTKNSIEKHNTFQRIRRIG